MKLPKQTPRQLKKIYEVEAIKVLYGGFFSGPMLAFLSGAIFMSYWLSGKSYVSQEISIWWGLMSYALIIDTVAIFAKKAANTNENSDLSLWKKIWMVASINMAVCFSSLFFFVDLNHREAAISALCMHGYNLISAALYQCLYPPVFIAYTVTTMMVGMLAFWGADYFVAYILASLIALSCSIGFAIKIKDTFSQSIYLRFENEKLFDQVKREKEFAEQASLSKTKFLAAASHDLRQPLQSLSLLQAALYSHLNNDKQKEILAKANLSLGSLNELLDSLLDISKLDAGIISVNQTTFDLEALVHQEIENHKTSIEGKRIQLSHRFTGRSTVFSDPVILTRILSNLISNACRYTEHGQIEIDTNVSGKTIQMKISDTGIGIENNELDKIFCEFYQVDNPERDRTKGLGLGLSIVKRLTDLLGGNISVESQHGKGSTFILKLEQTNLPSDETKGPSTLTEQEVSSLNILVIDDEIMVRESMQLLLESWGCLPHIASNLYDAMSLVSQHKNNFDALLVDFSLENRITGLDCIDAIEKEVGRAIPALIITGDTSPERVKELEDSGRPFIHKPINSADLKLFLTNL